MKLSLMNFHKLAMNRIETDQVHNISSKFMKLSLINFREQAMNRIDPNKFIKNHCCSPNSPYELHELNHERN